jgi:hypothetical protein
MPDPVKYRHWALEAHWRMGHSVGRTIYAQVNPDPSKSDVLIGVMDSWELADEIVMLHNRHLAQNAGIGAHTPDTGGEPSSQ